MSQHAISLLALKRIYELGDLGVQDHNFLKMVLRPHVAVIIAGDY